MKFALGQAVPRTEDPRLLTGRGRYTDDFALFRLAHAYVLRSPYAHARIRSVDIRAAQQLPGVLVVLTREDWAQGQFGAPRPVIPRQRRDGSRCSCRHARRWRETGSCWSASRSP
jgi:carbon-monoxide dehydrogenase large subunit